METKAITPKQVAEKVKKLIEANTENISLIINGINEAIVTQQAQYPDGFLREGVITLQADDILRPNKNWHIQSEETADAALKTFEKHWIVTKIGKWSDGYCHVEFIPRN